jgi:hypothetical protein
MIRTSSVTRASTESTVGATALLANARAMTSPHLPSCWEQAEDVWDDGEYMYCGDCGALLATWPEDSDRGWEYVA